MKDPQTQTQSSADDSGPGQTDYNQGLPDNQNADGKTDSKTGARQAESMLNRLKDQPGRAMMPHYQKREVEKDW
jgi:Ca-activated chloride channel family protein